MPAQQIKPYYNADKATMAMAVIGQQIIALRGLQRSEPELVDTLADDLDIAIGMLLAISHRSGRKARAA